MVSLSVSDLSYSIGVTPILTNVSFSIEIGDKLGIVGVNGAGKTTLLRLITGEIEADCGDVYISNDKKIGILKQNDAVTVLDEKNLTVLEYMYRAFPELITNEKRLAELEKQLEIASGDDAATVSLEYDRVFNAYKSEGGLEYKSRSEGLLLKLGFEKAQFDFKVANLSGGQRTRLTLARLLFREPDILILDEPTNHLDFDTMQWLEGVLAGYKKTLIVVSHDRYFLDKTTNKTLDIENNKATLYKGSYSSFVEQKKEKRKNDEKAYQLQQKEIARLEAFIEQQRRWNREKNIIAAESREKAIARMDKVEKPENSPQSIRFTFDSALESGNDVLSVKNLKMAFSNKVLFEKMSFEIKKREKVFIVGRNGCGKSTLLKILQGYLKPVSGEAEFGYNVRIGYYDQENQNLDYSKNVLDELWDSSPQMSQTEVRKTLAAFMFRGDDVAKSVGVLSGGEKARLTIAKLILSKMNVLILDEPTNHLDIPSREALENALSAFDGTIIAVSHDRYFINKLATRVIDISDGVHDFRSGYSEYESYKTQKAETAKTSAETSSSKQKYLDKKAEDARKRKLESDRNKVSVKITKLEAEIEEITGELFGDAAYDYVRAAELDKIKSEKEEELLLLYEEKEKLYEQD